MIALSTKVISNFNSSITQHEKRGLAEKLTTERSQVFIKI